MSSSVKGCDTCHGYGRVRVNGAQVQCTNCIAPLVSNSIEFADGDADCVDAGYGMDRDLYTIREGHEVIKLNRDEVSAVIAHMQAWLDNSAK